MDRERIVQLFFFGFLAVMAYALFHLLSPFLVPIIWAALLAFLFHPALVLTRRLTHRRTLAAAIITLIVGAGVLGPALWLSARLTNEAQALYQSGSQLVSSGGLSKARDVAVHSHWFTSLRDQLSARGIKLEDEIPKYAGQAAKYASDYFAGGLASVAKNLLRFLIDFTIMLLTFFYFLRDGEYYFGAIRNLTPLHEDDKAAVFDTLAATLSSVMRGLMLTALAQGAVLAIAFAVLGVPYWAWLGILSALLGLLPFGGTALVWIPASIYLAYAAGWGHAIALLIWSVLAVAIIDNVIKPLAMGKGSGLPTVALFFGIAGGLQIYGLLGLFAGPAIISVFAALLQAYRKTYGGEPGPLGS